MAGLTIPICTVKRIDPELAMALERDARPPILEGGVASSAADHMSKVSQRSLSAITEYQRSANRNDRLATVVPTVLGLATAAYCGAMNALLPASLAFHLGVDLLAAAIVGGVSLMIMRDAEAGNQKAATATADNITLMRRLDSLGPVVQR